MIVDYQLSARTIKDPGLCDAIVGSALVGLLEGWSCRCAALQMMELLKISVEGTADFTSGILKGHMRFLS